MPLATNIKTARRSAKLSQHKLALRCSTTVRTVCRWESGESTPELSTLRRIAAALGVTLSSLVEETEQ